MAAKWHIAMCSDATCPSNSINPNPGVLNSNNSDVGVAFELSARISTIIEYYRQADRGIFDDAGKPNEPTLEAMYGFLRIETTRRLILPPNLLGKAAFLSLLCNVIESAKEEFEKTLGGSHVPVVLRQGSGGRFQVIGEAYVHGIMLGEAVNSGAKWESITLE